MGFNITYLNLAAVVLQFYTAYTIVASSSSSFSGFYNPLAGFSLLILEVSRSHTMTLQSVGLLWTSDQPVAVTST
jgi:hypothetical protein